MSLRTRLGQISPRARKALVSFLLVALALDFLFFTGFFASDDRQYLDGASKIAALLSLDSPTGGAGLGNSRLSMIIPSGVVYWLSDGSTAAVAWFHVLYHLALVLLAFLLGRLYHSERAGLLAAALAATSPIFYMFAGATLPDNVTAVWLAVVLLLLELALRSSAADASPGARRAFRWYFSIGLLIGVAYACKETALIITVPAAICVIANAPKLRDLLWLRDGVFMAAGLLAFVLLEILVLRAVMGEWVFRLSLVQDTGDLLLERMQRQGGANPMARLWFAVHDQLAALAPLTIWMFIVGALGYAFTRGRRLAPILFFWWPLFYMTVGSTSFTAYRPSSIQPRYYAIILVPAMVMSAIAGLELWRRWKEWRRFPSWSRGRAAATVIIAALVAIAWYELRLLIPRSGNIYQSVHARAVGEAYEIAQLKYPQYPVVLGEAFQSKMRPLLGSDLLAPHTTPPPYLLLDRTIASDMGGADDLQVEPLEVVWPALNRFEVLRYQLRRMVGLPPIDPPPRHPGVAVSLQLVTSRTPDVPAPGARLVSPWTALTGSPNLRMLEHGHVVTWSDSESFYLQTFGRGSYRRKPKDVEARLPAPTHHLRITMDARLTRGRSVNVLLYGYAYTPAGDVVRAPASAKIESGAAPTRLVVDVSSETPFDRFRLRLKVAPRNKQAGALFLGHPQIVPLAAP